MSGTLQRKVNKLLSSRSRLESTEMVHALSTLEQFTDPSLSCSSFRNEFRQSLDTEQIQLNNSIISSFQPILQQLNKLNNLMSSLTTTVTTVSNELSSARLNAEKLISTTKDLQTSANEVKEKKNLLNSFLSNFQLSDQDITALESDKINDDFFNALSSIGKIRSNCQILLNSKIYHQRIGLDILDSLSKRLENGFEKLYRWVQHESINLHSLPNISTNFVKALTILKQMPIYYQHCIIEIGSSRRLLLIGRFSKALSRGGPNGLPRAIELSAHDPVRYCSDMFAWVHQAVASERDFFITIFTLSKEEEENINQNENGKLNNLKIIQQMKLDNNEENNNSNQTSNSNEFTNQSIQSNAENECTRMLSIVFEGLSRPLQNRVEQALTTQSTPEIAYKLLNVIDFYCNLLQPLFSNDTLFKESLESMKKSGHQNFYDIVHKQNQKLLSNPPSPTHDLSPSHALIESLNQINLIIQTAATSLVMSAQKESEFTPILSSCFESLLQSIEKGSINILSKSDFCVYQINNYHTILQMLRKYTFVSSRIETISHLMQKCIQQLVDIQTNEILSKSNLDTKLQLIDQNINKQDQNNTPTNISLSSIKGLECSTLSDCIRVFYGSLFAVGAFVVPQCDRILDSHTRRYCRYQVAKQIYNQYCKLYNIIIDPVNNYSTPNNIVPHTPQQIELLLELQPANEKRGLGSRQNSLTISRQNSVSGSATSTNNIATISSSSQSNI